RPEDDDDAGGLVRHPAYRGTQRPAQFFAAHADQVPQGVLDVNANQRRQLGIQVSLDQGNVHVLVDVILITAQAKGTIFRIDRFIVNSFHRTLILEAVSDQIG